MVSIIIPIYNVESYLRQCLDSVMNQTCSDWEALLIDDFSGDGSAGIAEEYCKKDSRFRLIRQEKNNGQSAARNRGLDEAKGDFVAFLDADDWWDRDFLARHLTAIDGYDVVQSGYRRWKDGQVVCSKRPLHKWRFTSACMRLYRKKAIDNLRFSEGHCYEDVLWTADLMLTRPKIKRMDYVGYNYMYNPESTTSSIHVDDMKYILSQLLQKRLSWLVILTFMKLSLYFVVFFFQKRHE